MKKSGQKKSGLKSPQGRRVFELIQKSKQNEKKNKKKNKKKKNHQKINEKNIN